MREKIKKVNSKGITLIALVVTIIVLLILAGVSIATLTGQNGLLTKANSASEETRKNGALEKVQVEVLGSYGITGTIDKEKLNENLRKNIEGITYNGKAITEKGASEENRITSLPATVNVDGYDIEITEDGDVKVDDSIKIEVSLDPDTGKEELILVYDVVAGDTIELPYCLTWYDGENENPATFNFSVDWGDGEKTDNITNADIETKAIHQYQTEGEKRIKITGTYESLLCMNEEGEKKQGIEKLIKVEQWGTTGIKSLALFDLTNLTQITTPTESSFKELTYVYFSGSGIQSIPDKLFANCKNVKYFDYCFENCDNLETIGNYAFANCESVEDFSFFFYGLANLRTIGNYVFVNCKNVQSFEGCFYSCTNLKRKIPELWLMVPDGQENGYIGIPDGIGCFCGCTNVENYEQIPDYWKANIPE